MYWAKQLQDEMRNNYVLGLGVAYIRESTVPYKGGTQYIYSKAYSNIPCVVLSLLAKIYNFWQVCSFVGVSVCLSVSLSVLSSITHERFDISSPNLVHIWNGWAVPVCDIDK